MSILSRPTARLVVIGDEILSGKVLDTNSAWLLRELRQRGVACTGLVIVPDDVEDIARSVRDASERADHVFTSGGVGPTHDDVTLEGIAAAFDRPLVEDPLIASFLAERWTGAPNAAQARMALVPQGSHVENLGHFPQVRVENVYIFPGVPRLFRNRWLAVADRFSAERLQCAAVRTLQSEGEIAAFLEAIEARFEGVAVGSYPRWDEPDVKVLITLEADDRDLVARALQALLGDLDPSRLGVIDQEYRPEDGGG